VSQRLHKVLAASGLCSLRTAEGWIRAGRVRVDGRVASRPGTRVDPLRAMIEVDGRQVASRPRPKIYLMLNKPRGYVTTLSDPEGRRTVADLLRGVGDRVFPIGRLDYASEGLLLATNDGDLAHSLMHPASAWPRTYSAKVRGRPDAAALARLTRGVPLAGRPAVAVGVNVVKAAAAHTWIEITVVEGRKHVVRLMLQSVGHPVLRLKRIRYGSLALGRLAPGEWRRLRPAEIDRLREAASRPRTGRGPRGVVHG